MKRILIFSLQYYPFIGGAEVAIKEITDRIDPTEIEFHLLTLRYDSALPKMEKIGNVTVHRIGLSKKSANIKDLGKIPLKFNKQFYQLYAPFAAEKLNKKYHFDAVWAMMAHATGIPAGTFKNSHKAIPYILTLQEGDPPEYIENLMRPVWALFVRGFTVADYLQAISTFLLSWGERMGFKSKSSVIPNGVDGARFSHIYPADEIAAKSKELGKKESEIFLVTTSRLVAKNAIDDVIRAMPTIPSEVTFLICGIGADEEMLRELAKDLDVENRVRFLGQVSHADMPLLLQASDIFIRPSRSEGMGNSFIEAMAARLPIIATQEGGIADFLFDEVRNPSKPTTGWAVDVNAPEQIADAVTNILQNPEKVKKVTAAASEMVKEEYDWNSVASRMRALFAESLGATAAANIANPAISSVADNEAHVQ